MSTSYVINHTAHLIVLRFHYVRTSIRVQGVHTSQGYRVSTPPRGTGYPHLPRVQGVHTSHGYRVSTPPKGTGCSHLRGVQGAHTSKEYTSQGYRVSHLPGVQGVHTSQGYRVFTPPRGTWCSYHSLITNIRVMCGPQTVYRFPERFLSSWNCLL